MYPFQITRPNVTQRPFLFNGSAIYRPLPPDSCPVCRHAYPHPHLNKVHLLCCGNSICNSCSEHRKKWSNLQRGQDLEGLAPHKCPICNTPLPLPFDRKESALRTFANQNKPWAITCLAETAMSHCDWDTALYLSDKAAALGHPDAYYNLGLLYEHGYPSGIHRNRKRACMWYQKAVDEGVDIASFALRRLYLKRRRYRSRR